MYDGRPLGIAGMHEIIALLVGPFGGGHTSNDRNFIRMVGKQGKVFGKLDSIRLCFYRSGRASGFSSVLWVKGVEVSHPTRHINVNYILGLGCGGERSVETQSSPFQFLMGCPGENAYPKKNLGSQGDKSSTV